MRRIDFLLILFFLLSVRVASAEIVISVNHSHTGKSRIVDPSLKEGNNFSVNISIANVEDPGLYAYELKLYFKECKEFLEAVDEEKTGIPDDHFLQGENIFIPKKGEIDEEKGFVFFTVTLVGEEEGRIGGGTLGMVTFNVTGKGSCYLELQDVILVYGNGNEIPEDEYILVNGFFSNVECEGYTTREECERFGCRWCPECEDGKYNPNYDNENEGACISADEECSGEWLCDEEHCQAECDSEEDSSWNEKECKYECDAETCTYQKTGETKCPANDPYCLDSGYCWSSSCSGDGPSDTQGVECPDFCIGDNDGGACEKIHHTIGTGETCYWNSSCSEDGCSLIFSGYLREDYCDVCTASGVEKGEYCPKRGENIDPEDGKEKCYHGEDRSCSWKECSLAKEECEKDEICDPVEGCVKTTKCNVYNDPDYPGNREEGCRANENCRWCQKCEGQKINKWGREWCTGKDDDCGFECNVRECQAECDPENPCSPTECDDLDGCYGGKYYDCEDVQNACRDDCTCERNECPNPMDCVHSGKDSDGDGWDDECEECDNEPKLQHPESRTEMNCDDGIDNDCDGFTDGEDPDCGGECRDECSLCSECGGGSDCKDHGRCIYADVCDETGYREVTIYECSDTDGDGCKECSSRVEREECSRETQGKPCGEPDCYYCKTCINEECEWSCSEDECCYHRSRACQSLEYVGAGSCEYEKDETELCFAYSEINPWTGLQCCNGNWIPSENCEISVECEDVDVDEDGEVRITDINAIALRYRLCDPSKHEGCEECYTRETGKVFCYEDEYDVDKNGKINLVDLALVSLYFGEAC